MSYDETQITELAAAIDEGVEDRIAQLMAALNIPCPECQVRAHFPCEPLDNDTHEARVRAAAGEWTAQELHIVSTVFAQFLALIEGPPVNGDARTVALVRHVQRKAIQLAFNRIAGTGT